MRAQAGDQGGGWSWARRGMEGGGSTAGVLVREAGQGQGQSSNLVSARRDAMRYQ